ncbi:MAG: class I SAM-dependent methyltransferase [Anaerolineaceae bacterium]|nr:class I SAM-dependent methyltransferase [Anaerolineaceae bacterium]
MTHSSKQFYEHQYQDEIYANAIDMEVHAFFPILDNFISKYQLEDKKCLELGCGRGAFQDRVEKYFAIDYSFSTSKHLHKPFSVASGTALPFPDNTFDVLWTHAVLEHIHDPQSGLEEIRRVLKSGGLLLLAPAWHCAPWLADGYPVRRYADFNIWGKMYKAIIPLLDSKWIKMLSYMPIRIFWYFSGLFSNTPSNFHNKTLRANFTTYWMSDSDALNSMDQYDAIRWFTTRGDQCLTFPTTLQQLSARGLGIILQIQK